MPKSVRKIEKVNATKRPFGMTVENPDSFIDDSIELDLSSLDKERKFAGKPRKDSQTKEENSDDKSDNKSKTLAITCCCCGKAKYADYFYLNPNSSLFLGTQGRVPICKSCIAITYSKYVNAGYEPRVASAAICANMDLPYNDAMVFATIKDNVFAVGNYSRTMSTPAMRNKTFINSIVTGELFETQKLVQQGSEKLWTRQDKQNKSFVLNKLGYDPFESFGYEDQDYRSAFNITAKYLEDESICQDAHKVQSLITMVATIIQSNKIETLLTYQYKNINPDETKIKTLTATKKDLQITISKLAEDNNISSKYQKEDKATQTHLSAKIKEMQDAEYWESKPNMFDVRTGAAMRQVFDLSHQSIVAQLELEDSDYANMVKEQREMIKNLQDKCDRLEEENRNLSNMLINKEASEEGGQ